MSEFKKYTINRTLKKGIDDLLPEYMFKGNSQGDESITNNVDDYKASSGWMSPVFCEGKLIDYMNQKEVDKEIERRKLFNKIYIKLLKSTKEFGKEIPKEINIHLKHNPIFDK